MMPDGSVTDWRLGELEKSLREMRSELKVGLASLNTKLEDAGRLYMTRHEYEQRHRELQQRVERLEEGDDQSAVRMWLAVSAIGTLGSFIAATLAWTRPLH